MAGRRRSRVARWQERIAAAGCAADRMAVAWDCLRARLAELDSVEADEIRERIANQLLDAAHEVRSGGVR